jgi:hypothetical protein
MAWLKRNLFFAISGIVSLALLVLAGIYDFHSYRDNSTAFDTLNETYSTLQELASQKPSPGNNKVNNIDAAREQEQQLRAWIDQARKNFQPIESVPNSPDVTSEAFAAALRRMIDQLQHEADAADVTLPPQYSFSFEAQRSLVKFAPGSLPPLAVQLGEVKTISEILFAARVNALDGLQRVRVSDDDVAGPQADYFDDQSVTNSLAVMTPYMVTFRCFSGELASVLSGFASSSHGFIVKAINVAPAGAGAAPGSPGGNGSPAGYGAPQPPPMMSPPPTDRGGLVTVLNEQLLRVTLEIEIVKLLPKK